MSTKLQFTCKRKRNAAHGNFLPFPSSNLSYEGIFTGLCVEIAEPDQIKALYENGCYGKGSKSRGPPAFNDPSEKLLLGLEEACFLAYYLKVLKIKDLNYAEINWNVYVQAALQLNKLFIEHLAAYVYLKSKNWVIKSGIKFGGDFLVYKQSPRNYHASFLVIINTPSDTEHYIAKNLKGVQRVAETSDKDVLLLVVKQYNFMTESLDTPKILENLNINELVIRRFNYSAYVQSRQQ